ncbi:hypothetical protein [Carboxylicivirga sp. N1Y90]|uniref:hypothetical protein n=1 Tax=Carboxylicivirga fragile TaxID=3417571 RepID=UPI003D352C4C|nr:hypothetical protein [Marinilabiliaceae bacterium N1Y90]
MEVVEVACNEFENIAEKPLHVFQSVGFNELNKDKCDQLHYLLFKESKYKLALVLGVRGQKVFSPFSAPFGGFFPISFDTKLSAVGEAIKELSLWLKEKDYKAIDITLPPDIYHPSFIAKQINCLWRYGYDAVNVDLNYAFDLNQFTDSYIEDIPRNARKNLKVGLKANLSLHKCEEEIEKKEAYQVIAQNRKERGFPLRMTWEQVKTTSEFIKSDFFLLRDTNGISIASAVVFHVTKEIVQVIYWGDLGEFSKLKTMNVLSFRIFEYYKGLNLSIVDIGPSTEDSEPNHGLAEFKESIGCTVSPKYKFSLQI